MLIGEPKIFAVECEITSRQENFIYGKLRIWLDGRSLGQYSEEVLALASTTGMLRDSLKFLGKHQNEGAEIMTKAELLSKVWDVVYGRDGYNQELHDKYYPYVWLGGSEGFETVRSLKVDVLSGQRMIWQNDDDPEPFEIILPKGHYESVVRLFFNWIEKEARISSDKSQ